MLGNPCCRAGHQYLKRIEEFMFGMIATASGRSKRKIEIKADKFITDLKRKSFFFLSSQR